MDFPVITLTMPNKKSTAEKGTEVFKQTCTKFAGYI